jgi:hypothetical protein
MNLRGKNPQTQDDHGGLVGPFARKRLKLLTQSPASLGWNNVGFKVLPFSKSY